MTFPTKKTSVLDDFPLCPKAPPLKTANFIFIVVSPSLRNPDNLCWHYLLHQLPLYVILHIPKNTIKLGNRGAQSQEVPINRCNIRSTKIVGIWRVPNPPGANPLVAEKASWRSSQSRVTGGQQPIVEIPTDSCHFFCTPGNPSATPIVTRGEGSFSYQGVSTRGVRLKSSAFLSNFKFLNPFFFHADFLARLPLQSLAVKKNFFWCKFWAVKNF